MSCQLALAFYQTCAVKLGVRSPTFPLPYSSELPHIGFPKLRNAAVDRHDRVLECHSDLLNPQGGDAYAAHDELDTFLY